MDKVRNKIITISGEPASGKSTVLNRLKEIYESMGYRVHIVKTGHVFRERATKEYLKMYPDSKDANLADIQEDEIFAEKRAEIDAAIDTGVAQLGKEINSEEKPNDVYIIDSRLAWHNIPDSFAVRLTVDEEIAGQRAFKDESRGSEDSYKTLEEAVEKTKQRKLGEIARYKKRYNVDLENLENYDMVTDTSFSNIDELAEIIIAGEKAYREGKTYPKLWASPATFLTEQREQDTNNSKVQKLVQIIQEKGFDPMLGMVSIAENEGVKILRDGNHRVCAQLSRGKTLVPYKITNKDDEYSQRIAKMIYDDPSFNLVYDWADALSYFGGDVGGLGIEQIRDLNYLKDTRSQKNLKSLKDFKAEHFPVVRKLPQLRKIIDFAKQFFQNQNNILTEGQNGENR